MKINKIIIDTDIGDDIDDAFAIALAMATPETELIGVTTVYKNAVQRAHIAKAVLSLGGRNDVPVYAGINEPIKERMTQFEYEKRGKDGLIDIRHYDGSMKKFGIEDGDAADFLLDSADKYPGEIILVGIGPLTNIAAAYARRPKSFAKFAGILLMNGFYGEVCPEWNVMCDPEATRAVYSSGVPVKTVGANCTRITQLAGEDLDKIRSLGGELGKLLNGMLDIGIKDNKRTPIMHDALAIATLYGDFTHFVRKRVYVPLENGMRGYTVSVDCENECLPAVEISLSVDARSFMDSFTDRLIRFTKK
ncbi:MAG: nucleoside hydrolase [Clostridia bacterium]|nr:nucleoside hydrolase [Clostridia bacterium]